MFSDRVKDVAHRSRLDVSNLAMLEVVRELIDENYVIAPSKTDQSPQSGFVTCLPHICPRNSA